MKALITYLALVYCLIFPGHTFSQPFEFFPGGTYNSAIPTPESILGFEPGEQLAHHHQVVAYFKKLAEVSPRAQYFEAGYTHEGRLLGYLLISSQDNMQNLAAIKEQLAIIADPRKKQTADLESTPAAAWMMYSIHGNETSGTEAAVQLAYQLTAGTDARTMEILKQLVVGIDPMENPDGRERFIAQVEQWQGNIANSDIQSITHSGVWPYGRGNHYLFDLNRDWFILANPESRARMKALQEWNPQLVVDAHEMGSYSTFLFNPPREPINFNIKKPVREWWRVFSLDQAKALDQFGWSYYTRSWYDNQYPGYGEAANFWGAIALLYEQANTDGSLVKQPTGKTLTYREAVQHQFISSMANLTTAAKNRVALLQDFHAVRKDASSSKGAFYIPQKQNPGRVQRLVERLLMAGIEVYKTNKEVVLSKAQRYDGSQSSNVRLPSEAYVVPLGQPLGYFINSILEFDPRMLDKVLQREYEDLQKGKGTHLYEVTAWSMLLAYGLDSWYSESSMPGSAQPIVKVEQQQGMLHDSEKATAFILRYHDDQSISALLEMFEKGMKVRGTTEPFEINSQKYERGSLLLRLEENDDNLAAKLQEIANKHHVHIYGTQSMRVQQGPDLGGGEFPLLEAPRIAVLTGPDLSGYSVGTMWYLLDYELGMRFSLLNHDFFDGHDLRKYNVLVMPDTWGSPQVYHRILGKAGIQKIKDWVKDGGTLIALNDAAAFLADSSSGFSKVQLRRQALDDLQSYKDALDKEDLLTRRVDSLLVWEGKAKSKSKAEKSEATDIKELKDMDERGRMFQPRGAILNTLLDEEHWLNYGAGKSVPAIIYSSYAFLSKKPVQTAARYDKAESLRLSGLLWPEAKERWAQTAYVTREASGKGQIILFAGEANFRSYFYGTTRLLLNAMLLGPGMGTDVPVSW